jgi:hypothetical protein
MWPFKHPTGPRLALLAAVALLGGLFAWPLLGAAQDKQSSQPDKHKQPDKAAAPDNLAEQIRDLQAKLAKLETALKQKQLGTNFFGRSELAGDPRLTMAHQTAHDEENYCLEWAFTGEK